LKLDLINSAESFVALFFLCDKFLVVIKTFVTVTYNVTGISDVPVPLGLAESLPLYFLLLLLQAL